MIQKILMRLKHLSLLCLVFVIYNVSIGTSKVVLASNSTENKTPIISNNNNNPCYPVSGNVNDKYNKENGQIIGENNYPPFKEPSKPFINFVDGKLQQGDDFDGPQNFPPAPSVVWFKKYIFDFNATVDSVKGDYCAQKPANDKKIKSKITLISLFKRNWLFIFLIPIFFLGC